MKDFKYNPLHCFHKRDVDRLFDSKSLDTNALNDLICLKERNMLVLSGNTLWGPNSRPIDIGELVDDYIRLVDSKANKQGLIRALCAFYVVRDLGAEHLDHAISNDPDWWFKEADVSELSDPLYFKSALIQFQADFQHDRPVNLSDLLCLAFGFSGDHLVDLILANQSALYIYQNIQLGVVA